MSKPPTQLTQARPERAGIALYAEWAEMDIDTIPTADPAEHTMGEAVDEYVRQRVPVKLLDAAIAEDVPIEVHGIYPYHVDSVVDGASSLPADHWVRAGKVFNRIRPRYYTAPRDDRPGRRLIVAVPPGQDYVRHYASLVAHHVRSHDPGRPAPARVLTYPVAEQHIARWTGLAQFVRTGDRVLIGYVQELVPLLKAVGARVVEQRGNPYYGANRLRFPSGEQVCALGVRFSFWGCLSARLAAACRELGVREIIYAGKLGTLTTPADIYGRLFAPSGYVHFSSPPRLLDRAAAPPNLLLERYPELDSGVHMSVGTVLEEDLQQRTYARQFAAASIDNEISQIAAALVGGPDEGRMAFSAIHFATDYLRDVGERHIPGVFNLTNHRRRDALVYKRGKLREVAERLAGHYAHPLARTEAHTSEERTA